MKEPITRKRLVEWAGVQILKAAERILGEGLVLEAAYDPPRMHGRVLAGNRAMNTSLTIHEDGTVENHCPCYDSRERGIICAHVIAMGLVLVKRATDPEREAKYKEELRRASRIAEVDEKSYIRRASAETPGAVPAAIHVMLGENWIEGCSNDAVPIICEAAYGNARLPLDEVPRDLPLSLGRRDESILFVIEDMSEGPAKGRLTISRRDFLNLLELLMGKAVRQTGGRPVTVNKTPMTTLLRVDLDRENGEVIVIAHTELPFLKSGEFPVYIVCGKAGWVYGACNLWPLSNVLPKPYHSIYAEPVIISRNNVLRFFRQELPALAAVAPIESDISIDLFTIAPARPRFLLQVKGSPASLSATLYADYDGLRMPAARPDPRGDFSIPDPDDLLGYAIRNEDSEREALRILQPTGLSGETGNDLSSIVGERNVLNFLGACLPQLRRRGWRVELEGRVSPYMDSMGFATPVVHIDDGDSWFDVGFDFEDCDGASISASDVQLAIRKGDSFIRRNNRTILVDSNAIESMQGVFADCSSGEGEAPGHFRMSNVYAAFVKSSLNALDGVDVEDTPGWRLRAEQANRLTKFEDVDLDPGLESTLRPYQKDGVNWLRFLEGNAFCGLLADEMGLGKTLQALAWLQMERHENKARGRPVLVVCPTSLVENWAEEARRFVPDMRVLTLTGAERHEKWEDLPSCDMAITSYALLRRDLDRLVGQQFATAVLDEAQHIKNKSTQNALAAKKLKAFHRLVLTGTPIENSVLDLWSIMDFLMPGYLGSHQTFKDNYERPISRGGGEAEAAQAKLRRKIQPFMLRRLKTQVARDLPPKIEKLQQCDLSPDQQAVYRELLDASRRKIVDMVRKRGFTGARMQILTTLMRLRQVCCHLDLLKLPDLKARHPSTKTDLFFELLDEAIDGGHRVLVFSQFVTMLKILREQMDRRDINTCYLDGATKDRLATIHRFNTERSIPAFLISLKAGGTGLNLTGADMVIHFDPWWNPAVEDQATDRAHRIGQNRTVYSIKLITRGTVEEKVLALQRKKRSVINATVEADDRVMQGLSWEDVQELLEL